jgi:hypothetical protein
MILNHRRQELHQGGGSIGIPGRRSKLRQSAAGKIDAETWREVDQAIEEGMELGE